MTEIRIIRNCDEVQGLEISGHSGYAEEGSDIVCAALSTLIQTLEIGLNEILKISNVKTKADKELAYMGVFWERNVNGQVKVIVDTIITAFRSIERSYPAYTRIVEVSVNENL